MKIFFIPVLLLYSTAWPQEADTTALWYSKKITAEGLKKNLSVLASDEYEGRETGKKGQKISADYIAAQFKNAGIPAYMENTYFQEYPLIVSTPQGAEITVNGKKFEFLKDFYHFPGNKPQLITISNVQFLGYGISDDKYDDYKRKKVKGKTVMIMGGEPKGNDSIYFLTNKKQSSDWSNDYRKKPQTAKEKGVSLLLIVDAELEKTVLEIEHFLTSPSMKLVKEKKDEEERDMPVIYISERMANEILSGEKTEIKTLRKKIQEKKAPEFVKAKTSVKIIFSSKSEEVYAQNVIGFVEGGDLKNEYVFVTAHYDHLGAHDGKVFNGADDDGSGTVGVVEMAQAFSCAKKEGHGPRRSLVFMTVSGEEKGLLGSKYYTSNPVFPLEETVCDLNIDMIGRVDEKHKDTSNYVYIIGSNFISTELHEINELANKKYTNLKLDYTYNKVNDKNRFYYRSDHYNFAKNNIPVIFYFNGTHQDYHRETDEVSKINFDLMEKRTRLVFFTAWDVANRPSRIKKDVKNENH